MLKGSSPKKVYRELIRLHKEKNLSFQNVVTFNLDEYYPIEKNKVQSYNRYMREQLFDHIDIPKENINIPVIILIRILLVMIFFKGWDIKIKRNRIILRGIRKQDK